MAKILLNSEKGSPIKNVQIEGQILFKEKPFEVDSMVKIENDRVADVLLKLYGFLEVLEDKSAVQTYLNERKNRAFKCDKCAFTSSLQLALSGHQRKHDAEDRIDKELGIEVISDMNMVEVSGDELEKRRLEAEKKHLESGGIVGGWEDDTPMRGASM